MMIRKRKLSKYRDYTVLNNVDEFDKRKFDLIFDMSNKLQNLNDKMSEELYSFQPLMKDIWSTFYIENPELKENVYDEVKINKDILKTIMNGESFEDYRKISEMDELSSAIVTLIVGEKIYQWIQEMKARRKKLRELMEKVQDMENQQEKQSEEENQQIQKQQLQKCQDQLHKEFEKALKAHEDTLKKQIQESIDKANTVNKQVVELLGSGQNQSELKRVPLKEKIKLGEELSTNQKLQEVANWAGRMKSIALKKQRSKHDKAIDRNGVTIGSEVENILPSEWGMYTHPAMKADFLRRFIEGQTLQYDQKGKEELGKGPIVCCLDQSGSMSSLDTQSKGFLLALLLIAKRQKRDFAYIPFSYSIGNVRIFEKGKITPNDIKRIASEFLNGGTDFVSPLRESMRIINESRFKKADIIFITDGSCSVHSDFLESFRKAKEEKEFKVLSLVIGNHANPECCERFSEEVVNISDFNDEKSYAAFEI